jgi:hypothetical protein
MAWDDFFRAGGRDAERRDAALNQVLDDLHLLLDIHFALGGLHQQIDVQALGGLFRAFLHIVEERVVQRLDYQRDGGSAI